MKNYGKKQLGVICTLYVETISINKVQFPIAIPFAYKLRNKKIFFCNINRTQIFKVDRELAIKNLWENLFDRIKAVNIYSQFFIF